MKLLTEIKSALQDFSIPEKKDFYPRFFKSGKGEYAEGDQFIGVTVPDQRKIAQEYFRKISLKELGELLSSKTHEHRHCALLIMFLKFEKSKNAEEKLEVVKFYLNNKRHINNWDLVDSSCYKILGKYCFENQDDTILKNLSDEENIWSKRMAIVGTMHHVKKGDFALMKEIALKNMHHENDLIHKANGWLLREMGNKNKSELIDFLKLHYKKMPRTSLRYAIEKLTENLRQDFLKGRV